MSSKIYGYIRVSTKEQNEDHQRVARRACRRVISSWTSRAARTSTVPATGAPCESSRRGRFRATVYRSRVL